ncbi:MAG: glyoxalase/Bleomycin resistance/Dioxygenase superfamily protein [Hyphomicrobiales bacterium]|nr:glyoxalase/Bleomycin resistance/Dioxygenase superfamily protein [Hyphomicrobiales bacterium]
MSDAANAGPVPLRMSHVGFFVTDLPAMEAFYTSALGFTVTDRGEARGAPLVFMSWDPVEHHQVVLVGGRPAGAFVQINQISFRVESLEELQRFWRGIKDDARVTNMYGTNHGNAWSLYVFDPEGNRIEVFCDSLWYISQPCVKDLDLSLPAAQIRAESEAFCKESAGFMPIGEHQRDVAARIAAHTRELAAKKS